MITSPTWIIQKEKKEESLKDGSCEDKLTYVQGSAVGAIERA